MLKKDWNYPSKKFSFSPKALRKIHWWTYISPQKMCPASLTTFWYFGYSAPSPSVTLVFSPTTFRNSIGNFVNGLAGTIHFYSDPKFQRDRQKDQRVPTKKWGGRNLLIHRGGSEINGTSQEERGYSSSEFSLFISWGYAEILPKCLVLKFKIKKLQ